MKELHFIYRMELAFSEPASRHEYTLKCFPQSDEIQRITGMTIQLEPKSRHFVSCDSFGNKTLCGMVEKTHRLFEIKVEGIAATGLAQGRPALERMLGTYRYASTYTRAGAALRQYKAEHPFSGKRARETAEFYMHRIYQDMTYMPGVTSVDTTAEEAIGLRQGVCQDYAHILIALLRMEHIPARYVVGMMIGEGASHAWVEVEDGGIWYGIDPTNDRLADDGYIHISCGRDAYDCPMNKGVFIGGGTQRQSVSVIVEEMRYDKKCGIGRFAGGRDIKH